jgi:K+-transporting ATPase ATPase A chain
MATRDWLYLGALVLALAVSIPFVGGYLARVLGGTSRRSDIIFAPLERLCYRVLGVDPSAEQRWTTYATSVLAFSAISVVVLYLLQRLQGILPFNPAHVGAPSPALSWNTAVSFVTNTNWQNYSGETAMSYFTQMAGFITQNFVSAAAGIAVAVALIRGLVRSRSTTLGNFWVDLTRLVVRVLLPLSILATLVLTASGVIDTLTGPHLLHTVTGATQTLPGGAISPQEAIKELGTNGGGPYNANSAHPFENPNGFTNFFENYLLLLLPFSLPWTFGVMAGRRRQGASVLAAMAVLWFSLSLGAMYAESAGGHPVVGVTQHASATVVGGNLTGKEVRFGAAQSALFNSSATATSTGSVDSMGDSYTALGGGVLLTNMMFGEVSPGGVGSGLYGMLVLALVSVFIAGLMVGRTPEYLGKKIQAAEMKLVAIYILIVPFAALSFAAFALIWPSARQSLLNHGAHGLTEMVYAFVSTSNNNGSAFAGLNGNTGFFNVTLGLAMLIGRFATIVPILALAGSLGAKPRVPDSAGTLPTGTPLFAILLTGVTVIIVGLTYFPVLALGPLLEHFIFHV